jgi:hypothetical protein
MRCCDIVPDKRKLSMVAETGDESAEDDSEEQADEEETPAVEAEVAPMPDFNKMKVSF